MTLPLQTCHTSSDVHFCSAFVLQLHRFRFAIASVGHLLGFAETCFPVLFVNRFCNCIVFVLQLHRLPGNEDDIPVLSVSLCSLQPECRVNPCVKMKLPKPDPRRLQWPRQEPRQGHCQSKDRTQAENYGLPQPLRDCQKGPQEALVPAWLFELEGHPRLGPDSAERHARSRLGSLSGPEARAG